MTNMLLIVLHIFQCLHFLTFDLQTLSCEYGDYLSERKLYEEAGLVYVKGGHHQRALQSLETCCNWRLAVVIAMRLQYTPEKMTELCRRLASMCSSVFSYIVMTVVIVVMTVVIVATIGVVVVTIGVVVVTIAGESTGERKSLIRFVCQVN